MMELNVCRGGDVAAGMAGEEDHYIIVTGAHLRETLTGGGAALLMVVMASLLEMRPKVVGP